MALYVCSFHLTLFSLSLALAIGDDRGGSRGDVTGQGDRHLSTPYMYGLEGLRRCVRRGRDSRRDSWSVSEIHECARLSVLVVAFLYKDTTLWISSSVSESHRGRPLTRRYGISLVSTEHFLHLGENALCNMVIGFGPARAVRPHCLCGIRGVTTRFCSATLHLYHHPTFVKPRNIFPSVGLVRLFCFVVFRLVPVSNASQGLRAGVPSCCGSLAASCPSIHGTMGPNSSF